MRVRKGRKNIIDRGEKCNVVHIMTFELNRIRQRRKTHVNENIISLVVLTIVWLIPYQVRVLIRSSQHGPSIKTTKQFYWVSLENYHPTEILRTKTTRSGERDPTGTSNQQTHNEPTRARNDLALRPPTHPTYDL